MLSTEMHRCLLITTSLVLLAITAGFALTKYLYLGNGQLAYAAIVMSFVFLANIGYIQLGGSLASSQIFIMIIMIFGFIGGVINSGGFTSAPSILAPILPMVAILWFDNRPGWLMVAYCSSF
jgi:hypothetical protein